MKKAIFFDPYLETIGGGERYIFTLVESLLNDGWAVDVLWEKPSEEIKKKISSRFKLNIGKANFVAPPSNIFGRWRQQQKYDLAFWLSDGSVPFLFAKKNILHFQVPFHGVGGKSALNQIKLKRIQHVVCNSKFTKSVIDEEFQTNSVVVYPPVDIESIKTGKKENIILCVGRFSQLLQAKRQDVLIDTFKIMIDKGMFGWKLILAGATDIGGKEYFEALKHRAVGYPIELIENADFQKICQLYAEAKLFWYAAGFEIDETEDPEKTEHFGITTVEAMAAGAVPLVLGKGGPKEVIKPGENGFVWQTKEELINLTNNLINSPRLFKELSGKVIKSSKDYSKEKFCQAFEKLV